MKKIFTPQITLAVILILAAGFSRLIHIAPNIAAVGAMALFGGAYFQNKRLAFAIPLITMMLTDIIIGFHRVMIPVYLCFVFTVFLGTLISGRKNVFVIASASVTSSVIFFLVTNLPFWYGSSYPWNFAGAMESYTAAIPFFQNSLAGDLAFNALLFGSFEFAKRRIPASA